MTEPVATESMATEPVMTEPVMTEPVATENAVAEPVAAGSVAAEPALAQTVVAESVVTELPLTRAPGCPFDPPAGLAELRAERPLSRMVFPDGHRGWVVSGHKLTRTVLSDVRFSSRQELLHAPLPNAATSAAIPPAPPGMFIGMDPPDHTRYRRLLAGRFTVRRMRRLTAAIERITADALDDLARREPPVDLVAAYAQRVPALTICALLGVPTDDLDLFQHCAMVMNDFDATVEDHAAVMAELGGLLYRLVRAKRDAPTDDLLGDLTATELTDEELGGIAMLLLGAGFDTTANMIALGTFALLSHPDQLAELRADPELAGPAVEELLRYLSIVHTNVRTALVDVELGGEVIRAGESVAVAMSAANRDPAKFTDPDALDLRRPAAGHVAFGHGVHQCLGQQLARVELTVACPALFRRFPGLRLAVPPEQVPLRDRSDVYGVHRLPVTW